MDDSLSRFAEDLFLRRSGPMHFRFLLQPAMACFFAIGSGVKDAQLDRMPFLWHFFSSPGVRHDLAEEGWKDISTVFLFALALDLIFQISVFKWFYPGEALVVALALTVLPYILVRGVTTRILYWRKSVRERRQLIK